MKGKREAVFAFIMMAEPKWRDFQVQPPGLVSAMDDHGTIRCDKDVESNRSSYWRESGSNVVEFNRAWAEVRVPVAELSTLMTRLTVEVPVRLVRKRHELRFDGVGQGAKTEPKTVGGREFSLDGLTLGEDGVEVKLTVRGMKIDQTRTFGHYRFALQRKGKPYCDLYLQDIAQTDEGVQLTLRGFSQGGKEAEEAVDLTVTFPGETLEKKVRFDFENIRLP
ncbi:MAG: hypothetical protein ACYS47_08945 [Planctomycetota bacterium]